MIEFSSNPGRKQSVSPPKASFASNIRVIVAELEEECGKIRSIPQLYLQLHIKRRRLYDVMNVFTAIGCATRIGTDDIRWDGVPQILPRLLEQKEKLNVTNYQIPLSELFPPDTCVGLPSLTLSFIMLFPALDTDTLSMRDASAFFSRGSSRYKTTLSKLYQITLILGAIEMTERTENPSEVRLKAPFRDLVEDGGLKNPLAIEKLLNRPIGTADAVVTRKAEFEAAVLARNGG